MPEEIEKDCFTCNWFRSFRCIYDDDPLEPTEFGWCYHKEVKSLGESPDGDKSPCIGAGYVCSKYEKETE